MKRQWLPMIGLVLMSTPSFALDLNGYMEAVVKNHRGLEALRDSRSAAEERLTGADIELVPVLNFKSSYLSDKKQPGQVGSTETTVNDYSATLSKKFSSGTQVALFAKAAGTEVIGVPPAFAALVPYGGSGGLGVQLSQSLWKDAFGRSTRLRQERQAATTAAETGGYDLQARQTLASAESTYWDYLYQQQELSLRQQSLERAQKLEAWLQRRAKDGISDRADLLSAQALTASRRLQLSMAEDELTATEKKVRDFLELSEGTPIPKLTGTLSTPRDPQAMVGSGRIMRLDAYLSSLEAKARAAGALEAAEAVKADLVLSGSYATNSYEARGTASDGTKNWTKTDTPTTAVSVSWTYLFDGDVKSSVREGAEKDAEAARLRAARAQLDSDTAWSEMRRRHGELTKKIGSAEEIRRIQASRAQAEKEKFGRGRTITSNVVSSEQDAAEADLQLVRLQAEQRKLEAQSRLFVPVKE